MFLNESCGCFTMINYTATIFKYSGSIIAPKLSAIIVAAIQLVGTLVSTQLVDRLGRKVRSTNLGQLTLCLFCFFFIQVLVNWIIYRFRPQPLNISHLRLFARSRLQCGTIFLGSSGQFCVNAVPCIVWHYAIAFCGASRSDAQKSKIL